MSLHSECAGNSFDLHKRQIEAAADLGAEVIVLHPNNLYLPGVSDDDPGVDILDVPLARRAVACAAEHGVKLAVENGSLPFLLNAVEKVDDLGVCLDIGHVYFTSDPMSKFLDALKERLVHLHLQDILPQFEGGIHPDTREARFIQGVDHYTPGTGGIPDRDWKLLAKTLQEINYQGMAVFEVLPRNPEQTGFLGRAFMQRLLESKRTN